MEYPFGFICVDGVNKSPGLKLEFSPEKVGFYQSAFLYPIFLLHPIFSEIVPSSCEVCFELSVLFHI